MSRIGARQHEMHARVAPIRAMEYGVPIFRVASSGISQCVTAAGKVVATAPLFDDGARLAGTLSLPQKGSLPWDRIVAPICVGVTTVTICWLILMHMKQKQYRRSQPIIA
jgi:apolipoprotein N-acyltransferase